MTSVAFRKALFRPQGDDDALTIVTNIELFYDLVFVFAITQLSHRLLAHLTPVGAVETLVLFLAIWWLWIYTSWATNWLDPERGLVRFMLITMMFGGLVMASALPYAFTTGGWVFAGNYAAMQILRTLLIVWASWGHHPARARNFVRIVFSFLMALPFWVIGAFLSHEWRLLCWGAALAIEYAGPVLFFRTPGLGKSSADDWDISGSHMAERCSLFIIIALGEAVLVTGATFSRLTPSPDTMAALAVSFAASTAMWWIYFDTGAKRGNEAIENTADTGKLARNAYTYLHMPIVAGIVVTAVGDELLLAHPADHATMGFVLVMCGGPLLFLIGNQAFKWMTAERALPPLSHFAGEAMLIGIGVAGFVAHWQPLTIGAATTAALIGTALWEWFSVNGGWQRWTPWIAGTRKIAPDDAAG